MYDRQNRFGDIRSMTSTFVGPTSYTLPQAIEFDERENFVPFLSSGKSGEGLKVTRYQASLPGPAVYYPEGQSKRVKGGTSLQYTSTRFWNESHEGEPNPTTYDPYHSIPKPPEPERPGKVCRERMPFSLIASGQSIPLIRDNLGYYETKYGVLQKVLPPDRAGIRGPAYYNVKTEFPCNLEGSTLQYKGNFWSRMTGKRGTWLVGEGPGPAEYETVPKGPTLAQQRDECYRSWKRFTAPAPRYLDIAERNLRRLNLPGPNYYSIRKPPGIKKKLRGGFLTSSRRFPSTYVDSPGPTDYFEEVESMNPSQKPGSVLGAPFLRMEKRFPAKKLATTPGPADYKLPRSDEELARKKGSKYALVTAAFECSAPRHYTFLDRDLDIPSPVTYDVLGPPRRKEPKHAVFKSRTKRFPPPKKEPQPDSLKYDVKGPLTRMYTNTSHRKPACLCKAPFLADESRFGRIPSIKTTRTDPSNPGPGDYERPCEKSCKAITGVFSDVKRFPTEPVRSPGPGAYTVHPLYTESCVKGTFNHSLGSSIPRFIAQPLSWKIRTQGHKRLVWFARGGEQNYKHC